MVQWGCLFYDSPYHFIQLLKLEPDKRLYEFTWFTWMSSGSFNTTVGYLIDPLSMFMCLFVTGVGFLIHIYSIGYMGHDGGVGGITGILPTSISSCSL